MSIVEATRDVVSEMGLRRVGLFGTRFTRRRLASIRTSSRAPASTSCARKTRSRATFTTNTLNELLNGKVPASTRDELLRLVDVQRARDRIEAVILAGTELPLVLTDLTAASIPLLDTTDIHVNAAIKLAWS